MSQILWRLALSDVYLELPASMAEYDLQRAFTYRQSYGSGTAAARAPSKPVARSQKAGPYFTMSSSDPVRPPDLLANLILPSLLHPPHEPAASILSGKTVVVVEDEGVTRVQLRRTLKNAGLVVVGSATNGTEGVEIVLRERPDLVLLDIRMPGAFDGLEAARRILAEYSVCVVMLTAF